MSKIDVRLTEARLKTLHISKDEKGVDWINAEFSLHTANGIEAGSYTFKKIRSNFEESDQLIVEATKKFVKRLEDFIVTPINTDLKLLEVQNGEDEN